MVFAVGVVGFYHRVFSTIHVNGTLVRWFFAQMFLLTLAAGVVVVPGAVAAAVRPQGRRETVYMSFAGALAILLLAESSVYAASADDFKERYLFAVLPLVAIAFGAYLRDRRPSLRLLVFALAAIIVLAVSRIPLSTYTAVATTKETDSEFLFAVSYVEGRLGVGTGSLVVALVALVLAIGSVAVALGRATRAALAATLAFLVVTTAFAVHLDLRVAHSLRASLPADLTWVDDAVPGSVTAVATDQLPSTGLRELLYWNSSIERELVLPGASPTDPFSAPPLRIGSNGELVGITGVFLYDGTASAALFTHARRVAHWSAFGLWTPAGQPRFRALVWPRYPDGWLTSTGMIEAWPLTAGHAVRASFALSLPRSAETPVRLWLGSQSVVVPPGRRVVVACRSHSGRLALRFSRSRHPVDLHLLFPSARLTGLAIADVPAGSGRPPCTASRD